MEHLEKKKLQAQEIQNERRTEWKKSPSQFVRDVLLKTPNKEQELIFDAISKHDSVAVRSGHGIGKTFAAAAIAQWFLSCFPESKVITTAPTWSQVKDVLWAEIHNLSYGTILRDMWEYQITRIVVDESHFAMGRSTDKPERLEGFHAPYLMFIVDEAKGISDAIYNAIKGTQTTKTKILLISTPSPNPMGAFYKACTEKKSLWKVLHFSSIGASQVNQDWVKKMKIEYGENNPIYQMKVLGEFPEITEDMLIPFKHITTACTQDFDGSFPRFKTEYNRVIGVDVARFGSDKTVIMVMDEYNGMWILRHCEAYTKKPTTFVFGKVIELDNKWKANKIKVDDTGIGGAVTDMLNNSQLSDKVVPFISASTSDFDDEDKKIFLNWKSKSYDKMRKLFERGSIQIHETGELLDQLSLLRYEFTNNGKLKIKDFPEDETFKTKKSPDYTDAMMIAISDTGVDTGGVSFAKINYEETPY